MENQSQSFVAGNFKFSGVGVASLADASSQWTVVGIAVDSSVSIAPFAQEITKTLKNAVESCQSSPQSDNLLVRVTNFDRTVNEVHGFKELNKCALPDYDSLLNNLGGSTSLYDAAEDAFVSVAKYGKELYDQEYDINSIVIILTDGVENSSSTSLNNVKTALENVVKEQQVQSLISILVGVNTQDSYVKDGLENFARVAGFSKFINIADASPKELAKLAQFISKSITSQSKSLTSGTPSAALNF